MMTLVSQAVFARMCCTTPKTVTKWKQAGKLVLQGLQVDVEATDARMRQRHRSGSPIVLSPREAALPESKGNARRQSHGGGGVTQGEGNGGLVTLSCSEIVERLKAMDWKQTFGWSTEAQSERAQRAAQCVEWEAVQSDLLDDGHWGGFQLRIPRYIRASGLDEAAIVGGFGFELNPSEVLQAVRSHIDPMPSDGDDTFPIAVRLELLPFLAHPFNEHDQPTGVAPR
jgi:hypothetical protein